MVANFLIADPLECYAVLHQKPCCSVVVMEETFTGLKNSIWHCHMALLIIKLEKSL